MYRITVLAGCLVLGGCVTANPMVLPSGERGVALSCGGLLHSMADCMQRAGEVCPVGYDVLNQDSEAIPIGSFTAGQGYASGFAGQRINRTMMVRCRQ